EQVLGNPSPARFSAECLDGLLYSSENAVKSLWRFRGKFVRVHQQTVDRATQMSACHAGGRGFESRGSRQSSDLLRKMSKVWLRATSGHAHRKGLHFERSGRTTMSHTGCRQRTGVGADGR